MNESISSNNSSENKNEISYINKYFLNTQNIDDSLSINKNKINKNLNIFENLYGSLNIKFNSFLFNNIKGNNFNKLEDIDKKEKKKKMLIKLMKIKMIWRINILINHLIIFNMITPKIN